MKKITFKSTPSRIAAIIFTLVSSQALAQNLQQNSDNKVATNLENSANSTTSSTSETLAIRQAQNLSKTDFESKEAKPTETTQKEANLEETEYDYIYIPGPGNSSFYLKKPRKKLAKNQISESQNQTEISKNNLPKNPYEQKTALSKTSGASKIKTQGHYFGVSGVLNKLIYHEESTEEETIFVNNNDDEIIRILSKKIKKPSSSGNGTGMGISYKYALNFNDFFIAPGFFYEKLNTSVSGSTKTYTQGEHSVTRADINDRYGFVADIGYDFNQFISPYFIAGYSWARYTSKNGAVSFDGEKQSNLEKSISASYVYGLGIKSAYNQNISFNFELQTQSIEMKTNTNFPLNDFGYQANYKGRLNTLKLGAFYNF